MFDHYGIKLDYVVNGARHAKEVQGNKTEPMPSKYPGKYRIDLHIDDDVSVVQNGRAYGFNVHLIGAPDDSWDKKVLDKISSI